MSVTQSDFLSDFPEFNNSSRYPATAIDYWGAVANLLLNNPNVRSLWDGTTAVSSYFSPSKTPRTMLDIGVELFVGHNLALEAQAGDAAAISAVPGTVAGPITSRGVNGVSVSYDGSSGIEEGAGHWNLTVYGRRFIQLARMVGTVPLQIGVGADPTGGLSGPGWAGPPPWIIGSPGSAIY